jgi:ABC-type enterochelin transport system substrate-binding protein
VSATNLFTVADETVIEFEPEAPQAAPSLFARVAELLGLAKEKGAKDDTRFADVTQAVEAIAAHGNAQDKAFATLEQTVADLIAAGERDRQAFAELQTQLSTTGNGQPRPAATGAGAAAKTDC